MLSLGRNYQHAIRQTNLVATPSVTQWGTRLTAHATPHSKGAWATLMTTTYDVYGFWIGINGTSTPTTQTDMMLDIAVGAGQENIIVNEFLCGWRPTISNGPYLQYFPIYIQKGALVSGRIQALITVDIADILMVANAGSSAFHGPMFSGCDPYGTVVAASQGTSHLPADTGTESTAADIGTTASKHYGAVMLSTNGTLATVTTSSMAYHWELVIGAISICEWHSVTTTAEGVQGPIPPGPFHVSIPAGTQLQIKGEASGAGAQAQDIAFYLFF